MRHSTFGLLCGAAALAAAGFTQYGSAKKPIPPARYTITPSRVTGDRTTGINASFRIDQVTLPNGKGIQSDFYGGACIVFLAEDLGYSDMAAKQCNQQEDCATGETDAYYCQSNTHKCWARPQADPDPLCRRSLETHAPWMPGANIPISQTPIPVGSYNLHPNAKALVISLLWGKEVPGTDPQTIVKWGEQSTIH